MSVPNFGNLFSPNEINYMAIISTICVQYRTSCMKEIDKLAESGLRNPSEIDEIRNAVDCNSKFLNYLVKKIPTVFHLPKGAIPYKFPVCSSDNFLTTQEIEDVEKILIDAAFEWTDIGDNQRFDHYQSIFHAIHEFLPFNSNIFVPGSKLCRLPLEIANQGYNVVANESSFVNFDLSQIAIKCRKSFTIYPFLHQTSGLNSFTDSLISGSFPKSGKCFLQLEQHNDSPELQLDPKKLIKDQKIFFIGKGFSSLFQEKEDSFDGVVTYFFIDTLKNPFKSFQLIYTILNEGGIWINFGPLIPRSNGSDFFCLETFDDINFLAQQAGFTLIKEERIETTNLENPKSHIKTILNCKLCIYKK